MARPTFIGYNQITVCVTADLGVLIFLGSGVGRGVTMGVLRFCD